MCKIVTGRRSRIATSSGKSLSGWAHIYIDCSLCDKSIGLRCDSNKETDNISDKFAMAKFRAYGWQLDNDSFLCPTCKALIKDTSRA